MDPQPTDDTSREIARTDSYNETLQALRTRIQRAQYDALKAVNQELVGLYRDIGRIIVEKQAQFGWGENVVDRLARDLRAEVPGVRGFSPRNLRNMRRFYETYEQDPNLQTVSAKLPWSHNVLIIEKCADNQERLF